MHGNDETLTFLPEKSSIAPLMQADFFFWRRRQGPIMAVDHSIEPKSVTNTMQGLTRSRHLFLYDTDMNSLSTDVNAIIAAENNSYDTEMDSCNNSEMESFDGTDMESYDIDMKSFSNDINPTACNDHTYSLTNMSSFGHSHHTNGNTNKLKTNTNSFRTDIDLLNNASTFSTDLISIFTQNNPFSGDLASMNHTAFNVDVNSITPTLKPIHSFHNDINTTGNESFCQGKNSTDGTMNNFKEEDLKAMNCFANPFASTLFPVQDIHENSVHLRVEGNAEVKNYSCSDTNEMEENENSYPSDTNTSLESGDRFTELTSMNVCTNPFNTEPCATTEGERGEVENHENKPKQYSEITPLHIDVQPPSPTHKRSSSSSSSSSSSLHSSRSSSKNDCCLRRLAILKNFTSNGKMGLNKASQQGISAATFYATLARKSSSERRKMVRAKRESGIKESPLLSEHKHVDKHTSCSTHVMCPYEARDGTWHVSHEDPLPVLVCVENMFGARDSYSMAVPGESTDMLRSYKEDCRNGIADVTNCDESHAVTMSDVSESYTSEMSDISDASDVSDTTHDYGLSNGITFSNEMTDISDSYGIEVSDISDVYVNEMSDISDDQSTEMSDMK